MRVKGASIQQFLLGMALLAAVCWNLAHAGELRGLQLTSGPTGTRAELRMDSEADYRLISLANPARLVVDLPGSSVRHGLQLPPASGVVRGVRDGRPAPGTTRIVFDLTASVMALKPHYESGADGPRLVLEWPGDGAQAPVSAGQQRASDYPITAQASVPRTLPDPDETSTAATSRLVRSLPVPGPVSYVQVSGDSAPVSVPSGPAQQPLPKPVPIRIASGTIATGIPTRIARGDPATSPSTTANMSSYPYAPVKTMQDVMRRGGLRPLIIAIDPGHGGQDSGAIGPDGRREKDITLQIGRELARQIDATQGLKSYMTRDNDVFIPLPMRARKANMAHADIFVSIHADASENHTASGSSVFVLSMRGASSQRARWLAAKENAADVIGGERARSADDVLTSVLLDLTQSGNMRASEDAASQVLGGLSGIGNNHKGEIERANFAVLRTSDHMPAMLVETAFISNPDEERQLSDVAYQRRLSAAILGGINRYFTSQPPPGTFYAARADFAGSNEGRAGDGGSP